MKYQVIVYYGDNQQHIIQSETALAGGIHGELGRLRQQWIQQHGFDIQRAAGVTWVLLSEIRQVVIEPLVDTPPEAVESVKKPKKAAK